MIITHDVLRAVCTTAPQTKIDAFVNPLGEACRRFDITTPERAAAFLAQIAHESGHLRHTVENLNYSAKALRAVWPKHFTGEEAEEFGRTVDHPANQEMIANIAYADRMGNGGRDTGDGWRYRGRGLIQLTGKTNYSKASAGLGIDLVGNPEMLEVATYAALSAGWFWHWRGLNAKADVKDFETITRRINGGTNGWGDRVELWHKARRALGLNVEV